ncbi:MAG: ABC transporter substrate-binding protein [candidate division KSB1 bacterium]|nr:ABC transporter substrate-binding protein [candidate division KSB1 bacterium]
MRILLIHLWVICLLGGAAHAQSGWTDIEKQAKGQTVNWFMWGGFPAANAYVNGYVAPEMKDRYDIEVRQIPVQDIAEVVSKLLIEKQAGIERGEVDLMWINGENFRTCKTYNLLYGPFAQKLPNRKYIDPNDSAVRFDFGEPVGGLESPWGSAQFVMIYDSLRTPQPPSSIDAFLTWIREHQNRFTYPAPPDFTGSVFIRHLFYHVAGVRQNWQQDVDQAAFERAESRLYELLRGLKPFLWRQGRTYPESPQKLMQMFADGQVDFAMSYHPADASRMMRDGLLPPGTRSFLFEIGTIANTHFVAIPFNARAKAAAMLVANFLLSPEAQLRKADIEVWGDLPVVDFDSLSASWRKRFTGLNRGKATLSAERLKQNQLPEPASDILIQLEKGWEREVLRK